MHTHSHAIAIIASPLANEYERATKPFLLSVYLSLLPDTTNKPVIEAESERGDVAPVDTNGDDDEEAEEEEREEREEREESNKPNLALL